MKWGLSERFLGLRKVRPHASMMRSLLPHWPQTYISAISVWEQRFNYIHVSFALRFIRTCETGSLIGTKAWDEALGKNNLTILQPFSEKPYATLGKNYIPYRERGLCPEVGCYRAYWAIDSAYNMGWINQSTSNCPKNIFQQNQKIYNFLLNKKKWKYSVCNCFIFYFIFYISRSNKGTALLMVSDYR